MQKFQSDFIEFLVRSDVLTFGDFTTKSGRKTPYFINTGKYRTGAQLAQLGQFYAAALMDFFPGQFDNLYGPAYKGIPLAVTASIALSQSHSKDVSVTYNRKEAKDHGEGGTLIGHKYTGAERVLIIEDVITAGTSIRESLAILDAHNGPRVVGVLVAVDRREKGQSDLSAIDEVKREFNLAVIPIVDVHNIIAHLHNRPLEGRVLIDDATHARILAYLDKYGV